MHKHLRSITINLKKIRMKIFVPFPYNDLYLSNVSRKKNDENLKLNISISCMKQTNSNLSIISRVFMLLWKIKNCKHAHIMQKYSVYNNHHNI